jgi:hypothetical protein
MAQESTITIQLVHGGYVLYTPSNEGPTTGEAGTKTEVFTSTAKLTKAVRAAIEEFTLVPKNKAEAADAE